MVQARTAMPMDIAQKPATGNLEASPTNISQFSQQIKIQGDKAGLLFPSITDTIIASEINNQSHEEQVSEELERIRKESDNICKVDDDVTPIPENAIEQTRTLLGRIHRNVPLPDMMWLESGGIGLEWRLGEFIVTMSLYGDNHVNFVAILGKQFEIAVTCPISDQLILQGFLEKLPTLFQQRT